MKLGDILQLLYSNVNSEKISSTKYYMPVVLLLHFIWLACDPQQIEATLSCIVCNKIIS
jgi:hypothetical protein